jgi:hypothetical protein
MIDRLVDIARAKLPKVMLTDANRR